jgi:hypothetical protein
MTSVPLDPNMSKEVRTFLDDLNRAKKTLTDAIDAIEAFPGFASQAQAEAGTDETLAMNPLRVAQAIAALAPTPDFLHVQEQLSDGTNAGGFANAAWRTRSLNTVVVNNISGASLSSEQVTLPAGDYYVEASAPAYAVNRHRTKLQNITAGATLLLGTTEYTQANVQNRSFVFGEFTLGSSSAIELQHRCSVTVTINGLGVQSGFGDIEIYSEFKVWKL